MQQFKYFLVTQYIYEELIFLKILSNLFGLFRESRQGIDLVKDDVELSLDKEVEVIRNIQERMRENLDLANSQLDNNIRKQVQLQVSVYLDVDNHILCMFIMTYTLECYNTIYICTMYIH